MCSAAARPGCWRTARPGPGQRRSSSALQRRPAPVHPGPGVQPEQQARQLPRRGQGSPSGRRSAMPSTSTAASGSAIAGRSGRRTSRPSTRSSTAGTPGRAAGPGPCQLFADRKSSGKARCSQVTRRAPAGRSSGLTWRSKYSSTSSGSTSAAGDRRARPRWAQSGSGSRRGPPPLRHSAASPWPGLQPAHQRCSKYCSAITVLGSRPGTPRRHLRRAAPGAGPTRWTSWSPATASAARSPPSASSTQPVLGPAAAGGDERRSPDDSPSNSAARVAVSGPSCAAAPSAPSAPDARRPAAPSDRELGDRPTFGFFGAHNAKIALQLLLCKGSFGKKIIRPNEPGACPAPPRARSAEE